MSRSSFINSIDFPSPLQGLRTRALHLLDYGPRLPAELRKEDCKLFVAEVFSAVGQLVDVRDIERRLIANIEIDFAALTWAIKFLKKLPYDPKYDIPGRALIPADYISKLETSATATKKQIAQLHALDVALRLEVVMDAAFNEVLICANQSGFNLDELKKRLKTKLDLVTDDGITELWERLRSEFDDVRRSGGFSAKSALLPKDFLKFKDPHSARQKLADYVIELRPKLIYELLVNLGRDGYPIGLVGLARMLSWKKQGHTEVTGAEEALARSISRAVAYWEKVRTFSDISRYSKAWLANLLAIEPDGRIFEGPDFRRAEEAVREARESVDASELLLIELLQTMNLASAHEFMRQPVERCLQRYRLGLEVTSKEFAANYGDLDEEALQRNLAKYLIDNGIYAIGTRFNRSEVDLFVEDHPDSLVIEVKRFSGSSKPTPATIRRGLVQLQSYMDTIPGPRRGLLLLYCFNEPVVIEPRLWLQGRYWVLPINLQGTVPSGRRRSLEIKPSTRDGEMVRFTEIRH
jgi:hypothetical protein